MRTRGALSVAGVLAAVGLTTMCTSPKEIALEGATAEARTQAERDRHELELKLRRVPPADSEVAKEDTVARFGPDKAFGSRVVPGGFEVDGVYYGRRDAGGGWDAEQASVRMCVRFTARLGDRATVALSDADCPVTLPTAVPGYGSVTRTVTLAD
ncbi:hypothetical protein [Umezawaea sp. NPDC059074]|uniref:hypothetical protein n=1 Tax=Umezawaea sp. NPDC059074 TaxID=3346716 RepID=UPI0036BC0DD7